jgi:hypothetical protein
MTVRTWVRKLFARPVSRPIKAPACRPARRPLSLEVLEDRTVPSAVWYVNAAATGHDTGTSWADADTDLQAALASARPGDQIWVAQGTYKPTGGTDRTASFALKDGVAVYGGFAGTETQLTQRVLAGHASILSGDIGAPGDTSDNSYHVVTSTGLGASAVLDGFQIVAGNANFYSFYDPSSDAYRGGGMYNNSSSPTLSNLVFTGNYADSGGGMYNNSSSPAISNVVFIGNSASAGGGMFNTFTSAPALSNVTFMSNSASYGGGVDNNSSSPALSNVTFSGNSASSDGGGMYNGYSSPTLSNVTFGNNRASDIGGGMYNTYSSPALSNVTFNGNSASNQGGGMYNLNSAPALTNLTFISNSASVGGGVDNDHSAPALTNVTFFANSASYGGGVDNQSSAPTLTNCILWRDAGGEIYNSSTGGATVRYSDVQGGYSGTGNISLDPRLGPFGNNGGPTQTIPLEPGSPAIDAGDNSLVPAGLTTDQRGFARVSGAAVDLGAYEVQLPAMSPAALPDGTYGTAYSQTLTATEGPGGAGGPYTIAVTAGALPAGLSLTPGGALTGTPSAAGEFSFTVTASDRFGYTGRQSYTLTIDPAAPAVSVTDAGGTYNGQPFSAQATVAGVNGTASVSGSFTFTYYADATATGTPLTGAPFDAGNYTVVAMFTSSDPNYPNASAQVSFAITSASTSIVVSASSAAPVYGQSVTLTATVTSATGATPTSSDGTVTFYDGATLLGSATLADGTGTATLTTAALTAGQHTIIARYSGDNNFVASQTNFEPTSPQLVVLPHGIAGLPRFAVDGQGDVFIADPGDSRVLEVFPDGSQTTVGSGLVFPIGVAVDSQGNLFIDDLDLYQQLEVVAGLPLTVSQATPTVGVSDAGGIYNGNAFSATASVAGVVAGVDSTPASTLEGVAPTLTYYQGTYATLAALNTALAGGLTGTSTAPTQGGSYTVVASFVGSTDYSSNQALATFTIIPAATSASAVGLSATTAVYGQPVTLTATVLNTQTAATPSGNVTFYDGATKVGTAPVGAGGVATLTVSTLGAGKHELTASFSDPAGNFVSSGSLAAESLTITRASTTTGLTTTTTTPVFGQAVTFTATVASVAPSTVTPTGSVTFKDGTTVLRTVLLSGGSASLTITNLAVASHSITVIYNASANFKPSGSATSAVTVSQDATTAVVTSSVSSPVYGQAVTLKATLTAMSPGSGKPTGTVSFYDGLTFLGTAPLSSGVASIKTTALAVGGNSITVVYGGDVNFLGTTSAALSLTVRQDATRAVVTSSSATAQHGTAVTLTATLLAGVPGSGTPTGTVSFWDGSTLLQTVNLTGGVAQLTYSFSVLGMHKIKAVYNGDADFLSTTSAVLTETIT